MDHHRLEGCGRISESKKHHSRFIKSIFGFECCLMLVSCFDPYIVILPSNVKFREDVCLLYLCDEFQN